MKIVESHSHEVNEGDLCEIAEICNFASLSLSTHTCKMLAYDSPMMFSPMGERAFFRYPDTPFPHYSRQTQAPVHPDQYSQTDQHSRNRRCLESLLGAVSTVRPVSPPEIPQSLFLAAQAMQQFSE
jgi:hypothetical protein